jgi:hypothetical protein
VTDLTPDLPPAPAAAAEWWRGAVIYQVYPRSYADTDGDGIGDLAGITAHLDHIASLGVDAVWLSPFFTSPMKDFGYDVADYCDVDPVFGTLADFDRLIARAHALGLKIITDLVLAHTSDKHPWFGDSRRSRTGPRAELDLDKLLSDVETTSKAATPPKKGGGKKGPKKDALTVQIGSGKRVSAATRGYLLNLGNDLSRRWNPNCLVEGGADVRAEVTFRVSFGGKLLGRPKSSEAGTKDPMVRVASERAIRAVYAAEPFNDFPPELYGEELIYPFDAPAACANR